MGEREQLLPMEQASGEPLGMDSKAQEEGTGRGEGCLSTQTGGPRKKAPEERCTEGRGGSWNLSSLSV